MEWVADARADDWGIDRPGIDKDARIGRYEGMNDRDFTVAGREHVGRLQIWQCTNTVYADLDLERQNTQVAQR